MGLQGNDGWYPECDDCGCGNLGKSITFCWDCWNKKNKIKESEICMARCTLPKKHEGKHIAHNDIGTVIECWNKKNKIKRLRPKRWRW